MPLGKILERMDNFYIDSIAKGILNEDMEYRDDGTLEYRLDPVAESLNKMRTMNGSYKLYPMNFVAVERAVEGAIEKYDPSSVEVITDLGWSKEVKSPDSTRVCQVVIEYIKDREDGEVTEEVRRAKDMNTEGVLAPEEG